MCHNILDLSEYCERITVQYATRLLVAHSFTQRETHLQEV